MDHFSSLLNGLGRSFSSRKQRSPGGNSDQILRSSGVVHAAGSHNFATGFSKRGEKGVCQDRFIVWEEFGGQEDTVFCGVFDGHGPWGHYVAKKVRELMPSFLLTYLQECGERPYPCNAWEGWYPKACAAIDRELVREQRVDSFHSGTTGLAIVKQGGVITVANIGDSRAVVATTSDEGALVAVQLTVDFKPSLPREAARIMERRGRVFCMEDEAGVERVWLPHGDTPGLAVSRAFGDYCLKEYGVISEPEVRSWNVSGRDRFIVLATDGVWDVMSNEEAVRIAWGAAGAERGKSARRLVEGAARGWRQKRRGMAMDDISAVCLFFGEEH